MEMPCTKCKLVVHVALSSLPAPQLPSSVRLTLNVRPLFVLLVPHRIHRTRNILDGEVGLVCRGAWTGYDPQTGSIPAEKPRRCTTADALAVVTGGARLRRYHTTDVDGRDRGAMARVRFAPLVSRLGKIEVADSTGMFRLIAMAKAAEQNIRVSQLSDIAERAEFAGSRITIVPPASVQPSAESAEHRDAVKEKRKARKQAVIDAIAASPTLTPEGVASIEQKRESARTDEEISALKKYHLPVRSFAERPQNNWNAAADALHTQTRRWILIRA